MSCVLERRLKIIWACANPQFFFGSHLLGQFFSHVFIHTEKVGPSIREVMNGIGLRVHLKIAWSKILCLIITSKKELAIQGYPLCLDAPFFCFLVRRPFHPHGSLHGFFGTSTYFESHCLRRVTIGTKHSTHVGFTNFPHVWQILRGHHF